MGIRENNKIEENTALAQTNDLRNLISSMLSKTSSRGPFVWLEG